MSKSKHECEKESEGYDTTHLLRQPKRWRVWPNQQRCSSDPWHPRTVCVGSGPCSTIGIRECDFAAECPRRESL
jgi:hypothetical protein